jgi:hypothetical protein
MLFSRAPGGWLVFSSMTKELLPRLAAESDPLHKVALGLLDESSVYNPSAGRAYCAVT